MASRMAVGLGAGLIVGGLLVVLYLLGASPVSLPGILLALLLAALALVLWRQGATLSGRQTPRIGPGRRPALVVGLVGLALWIGITLVAVNGTWDLAMDIGLAFAALGVLVLTVVVVAVLLVRGRDRRAA